MSGSGDDFSGAMIVVIIIINCGTAYDPGIRVCIRLEHEDHLILILILVCLRVPVLVTYIML